MSNKNFVEDMILLAGGVVSNIKESRHELKSQVRQRASAMPRELDLVTREEFDTAFAMLAKARNAQEELAVRLVRIESCLGLTKDTKPVKNKKKNLPSVKTKAATRTAGQRSKRR